MALIVRDPHASARVLAQSKKFLGNAGMQKYFRRNRLSIGPTLPNWARLSEHRRFVPSGAPHRTVHALTKHLFPRALLTSSQQPPRNFCVPSLPLIPPSSRQSRYAWLHRRRQIAILSGSSGGVIDPGLRIGHRVVYMLTSGMHCRGADSVSVQIKEYGRWYHRGGLAIVLKGRNLDARQSTLHSLGD